MTVMTANEGLLNEVGTNIFNVKKVLIENVGNPLIQNGLLSTLSAEGIGKEIYEKLADNTIDADTFLATLMKNANYTNVGYLSKLLTDFQKVLSARLEKAGEDHFMSDSSPETGVVIIRKFGITLDKFQRDFRLTKVEAKPYIKSGFVKDYSELKLHAFSKDIIEKVQKEFKNKNLKDITFEVTPTYFNEERDIYNVDFRISIMPSEARLNEKVRVNSKTSYLYQQTSIIREILKFVQGEFYKIQ